MRETPLGNVKIGQALINIIYVIKVESEKNPYKRVVPRANFQGIRNEMKKVDRDSILYGLGIEEDSRYFVYIDSTRSVYQ